MVGTVVLGIFPKEENCGDVFLYVVGCQRILRLEVNAVEGATIAAALLHGKNTLVKTSLDELRNLEIDTLLAKASVMGEPVEVDEELAEELVQLMERTQESQKRPEYALFHIYLDTLVRLQAELHCIVLSGLEGIRASLIVQDKARNERFSLACPLGDALALALYADVPVAIVPALVQCALPVQKVLTDVPEEVRSVVEAILPTPEKERRLQEKMDIYNASALLTTAGGGGKTGEASITGQARCAKGAMAQTEPSLKRVTGAAAKSAAFPLPAPCGAVCGTDIPDDREEEYLKRLLRHLVPETKVRM